MLGVDGQYCLQFALGGNTDWLTTKDFVFFRLSEEAGNSLPQFMLKFKLTNENDSVLSQLNETSVITASYGQDPSSMGTSTLYITEIELVPAGESWNVQVQGHLNAPAYLYNKHTGCSPQESGVECVINTAKKYFAIKTNIQKSDDSQNWVQHNVSDKQFVRDTWLHSHSPSSFISVGISALNNTFVLKEMGQSYSEGAQWQFLPYANNDTFNQISVMGSPKIKNISGFINSWLGYPESLNVFNIDTGLSSLISTLSNIFQGSGGGPLANSDVLPRMGQYLTKTANMHDNYHQAKQNNLYGNAVASSFQVNVMFDKIFRPVMVLDQAYFNLGDAADAVTGYSSGNYTVFRVVRVFGNQVCRTMVGMSREAPGCV